MGYADYNTAMNDYMKRRYHRRRVEWITKLGGGCVVCGAEEDLEFDHVHPETKEHSIAKILTGGSEELVSAEMKKCQLLCSGHHRDKTSAEQRTVQL